MKHTVNRALIMLLALMLLGGALLPAAMAQEGSLVQNATKYLTTWVGLRTELFVYDSQGHRLSSDNYKWSSSKSSVVSVTSGGVITARKAGSATITAVNRYNRSDRVQAVVTVKANKVNMSNSRPSPSAWKYKTWGVQLKSIQVVSPSRVDVEYYLVCNYPSNWRATRLKSMKDYIRAYRKSDDSYVATVVDGYGSTVAGFKSKWGRSVQVIRITYSGAPVYNTNLKLSDYNYLYAAEGVLTRTIS